MNDITLFWIGLTPNITLYFIIIIVIIFESIMLHEHENILLSHHIRVEKSPNYPVIGFSGWIIV